MRYSIWKRRRAYRRENEKNARLNMVVAACAVAVFAASLLVPFLASVAGKHVASRSADGSGCDADSDLAPPPPAAAPEGTSDAAPAALAAPADAKADVIDAIEPDPVPRSVPRSEPTADLDSPCAAGLSWPIRPGSAPSSPAPAGASDGVVTSDDAPTFDGVVTSDDAGASDDAAPSGGAATSGDAVASEADAPTILDDFDDPGKPWLAGHRGVDLAAAPGTPVLAPADATVRFSGMVAGKNVVSLSLGGDLVTTFEPATGVEPVGAAVRRGQVIAHVDGGSDHCADQCLHWGLRRGKKTYLDPTAYVSRSRIVLKPTSLEPGFERISGALLVRMRLGKEGGAFSAVRIASARALLSAVPLNPRDAVNPREDANHSNDVNPRDVADSPVVAGYRIRGFRIHGSRIQGTGTQRTGTRGGGMTASRDGTPPGWARPYRFRFGSPHPEGPNRERPNRGGPPTHSGGPVENARRCARCGHVVT